ncbi:MAG: HD domain-containing protein [Nitrospirae bacterium]|nr:HD domain-containing protein [Nitrospirota bacterium]
MQTPTSEKKTRVKFSDNDDIERFVANVKQKQKYTSDIIDKLNNTFFDGVLHEIKQFTENQVNLTKELIKIGAALSAEKNLDALLEMIVVEGMNFTNADGGTLYIVSPDEKSMMFKILQTRSLNFKMGGTSGKDIPFPPLQLYNSDGSRNEQQVSAYVALTGESVNIVDVYKVEGFDFKGTREFDKRTGYRSQSMLVVPLRNHLSEIIGVLQLLNAQDEKNKTIQFYKNYQSLVESLASQAAVAITNTSLISELSNLLDSFIRSTASAIDEKSIYTGGHVRRVAELTQQIAKALNDSKSEKWADFNLSEAQQNELRIAAWMHDIGKITTPEHVVDKATKLETIVDRIDLVFTRAEILKKDIEIEFLNNKIALLSKSGASANFEDIEAQYKEKINSINEDIKFIKTANTGGEFMEDAKINKIKEIATKTIKINGEDKQFLTPDEVQNLSIRRGTLSDSEREIIQNHAKLTIKMLSQLPWPKSLKMVPFLAGAHHETLAGTGYPNKLKAEDLPTQARIIALADIFEALTAADRPYKKGKTLSEAFKILGFMVKDNHLDKDIVNFFVESGLAVEYAKKELKEEQVDEFTYNGVKYSVSGIDAEALQQ